MAVTVCEWYDAAASRFRIEVTVHNRRWGPFFGYRGSFDVEWRETPALTLDLCEYRDMKVTFVGHASILVEVGGISILSDPWWRGPCFGAQWWNYPEPFLRLLEGRRVDYIYVSHGHHDHFHPATLNTLNKDATVLVSAHTGLAPGIRDLGFDVVEVPDTQAVALGRGGVSCRIIETCGSDTLMTITDGTEVCVNLNDALHSAPEALQRAFVARLTLESQQWRGTPINQSRRAPGPNTGRTRDGMYRHCS